MKKHLTKLQTMLVGLIEKAKVRRGLLFILGIFFVLQVYFVRELIAAELLFGLGFAVLMVLGGIVYLVGAIGERGLDWAATGVQVQLPRLRVAAMLVWKNSVESHSAIHVQSLPSNRARRDRRPGTAPRRLFHQPSAAVPAKFPGTSA